MIPTYNESENIEPIYRILAGLDLNVDFLFVDDKSPDGTGRVIDRLTAEATNVHALHRSHKMGVGAAHQDGIRWAYKQGYQSLLTMDCDFTHSPYKVKDFLVAHDTAEIVVGSRFLKADSLKGWVWYRKFLTHAAHQVTVCVLGMPYDASGAFRYYRLDRIPQDIFTLVRDSGYSFFWESLFIMWVNGIKIHEIPIDLPKRLYGTSNMKLRDVFHSIWRVVDAFLRKTFDRKSLLLLDSDNDCRWSDQHPHT
jgi:dolichol-phosphate mannosyltransferase